MIQAEGAKPAERTWRDWIAGPALCLAVLSLLALAAAPLSFRAGVWGVGPAFALLALAALAAVLGGALAVAAFVFAHRRLSRWRILLLAGTVVLGAGFVLLPLRILLRHAPPIHDITTDWVDPPALVTALPAREAEHAAPAAYGGPAVAAIQHAAYPDIVALLLPMDPGKAFDLALATARRMPRWTVIVSDPATGRIEATATSFWFGFVDDIVIRVTNVGEGTRVDMRSVSRQGKGDLGVNAARVRAYLAALRAAAG